MQTFDSPYYSESSSQDLTDIDTQLLMKLNLPIPRYTSYPTAPEWGALSAKTYSEKLRALDETQEPLSLYFHIPFCKTMCLFCGCSVVLNRKPENESRYVDYLLKEIALVRSHFRKNPRVTQLHFGGGTPTKLSEDEIQRLFYAITANFDIDFNSEISIEIDPRTVVEDDGRKLWLLKQLGFNRVSFGVQDTDPKVQEAIKRRQSYAVTKQTYEMARTIGFKGINVDLIYGLPFQTPETFADTVKKISAMRPDRIVLFSYAKIPWLKLHQNAIKEETLPSTEQKFEIYTKARRRFIQEGYSVIGMDHFALSTDEMAQAYHQKKLQRNFQGYSLRLAEHLIGFGITSTGYVSDTYVQNIKELPLYYASLDEGQLPVFKGKISTDEDKLRKWVIHSIMCNFELDKELFAKKFETSFDSHFAEAKQKLDELVRDGLLTISPTKLHPTPHGRLFIRNIASTFDAYLNKKETNLRFSQAV